MKSIRACAVVLLLCVWCVHQPVADVRIDGSLTSQIELSGPLENRLVLDYHLSHQFIVKLLCFDSRWIDGRTDSVRTVVGVASPVLVYGPVGVGGLLAEWWNPDSPSVARYESRDPTRLVLDTAIPPTRRIGLAIQPVVPLFASLVHARDATAADVVIRVPWEDDSVDMECAVGLTVSEVRETDDWFLSVDDLADGWVENDPIVRAAGRFRSAILTGIPTTIPITAIVDGSVLASFGHNILPGYRFRFALLLEGTPGSLMSVIPTEVIANVTLSTPKFRGADGRTSQTGFVHTTRFDWRIPEIVDIRFQYHLESEWRAAWYVSAAPWSLAWLQSPSVTLDLALTLVDPLASSWTAQLAIPAGAERQPVAKTGVSARWRFGAVTIEPRARLMVGSEDEWELRTSVELHGGGGDESLFAYAVCPNLEVSHENVELGGKIDLTFALRAAGNNEGSVRGDGSVTVEGHWSPDDEWSFDVSAGWSYRW